MRGTQISRLASFVADPLLILRFLISFRLFGYILTPFLGGSLESCLPYPSRGGKTFVLKQSFFQYIQNLPNPNGLASFASCVVWDLPAIATDRCRSNYSQDRKEKSIIRSFSLRRNPLQPNNLLAFSSKARKICPFYLFCYKIDYPPVKFWEAYLSQTFPPKSPQSKDSRRWARTAHGETIRAERAQRGHPSIHHSCSAEAHTQLPSQSFALCVPFYRQNSTILEPAKITGAWNWNV